MFYISHYRLKKGKQNTTFHFGILWGKCLPLPKSYFLCEEMTVNHLSLSSKLQLFYDQ